MAKLWKNTYSGIYGPWIESMLKLSGKMSELSRGNAGPEAYKEFYTIWMDTYKETYGKYVQSARPTKEVFDGFLQSTNVYLNMYKSWLSALEKMAEKTNELSKQTSNPGAAKEFQDLWVKMYEKVASEMEGGEINPAKYKDFYDTWMETYSETFKEFQSRDGAFFEPP